MKNSLPLRLLSVVTLSLTLVSCAVEVDPNAPPCSECDGRGYIPMVRTTTDAYGRTDREFFNQPCVACGHTGRSGYWKAYTAAETNKFLVKLFLSLFSN